MPGTASFGMLGPLTVTVGDAPLPLGGPRQQSVLGYLLLARGRAVGPEELIDAVYSGAPPPSAESSLYAHVSRLRRLLEPTGATLRRTDRGYVLAVPPGTVDVDSFAAALATVAGSGRPGPGPAITVLEQALSLWRGPVLGALRGEPWVAAEAARLEEQRAEALDALADAQLAAGRPEAAALTLTPAVAEQPLREATVGRLVTALYRAGRQGDALLAYEHCRRALADELGVDPGPGLQRVHEAVLRRSGEPLRRPPDAPRRPFRLPPRNPSFTARERLLADIAAVLTPEGPDGLRMVALHGLGGVGKSQVAAEFAHRRRAGYAVTWWVPSENDSTLLGALIDLARRRHLDAGPDHQDVLEALWDDLSAHGPWLLVLDDAPDAASLEPYLPVGGDVDLLVTSRSPSWARYGTPLHVGPLERDASVAFLQSRARTGDPRTAAEVAELLGDLPLALEQACAYLEQTGLELADYPDLFRAQRDALLQQGPTHGYGATVGTTWQLAFDRVRTANRLAARVLDVCAFLAPDDIPLPWLGALRPGRPDQDLEVHAAVADLRRYSLVDRAPRGLSVHRLVQAAVRARLSREARQTVLDQVVALLEQAQPGDPAGPGAWPEWARLVPHVLAAAGHCAELGLPEDRMVALLRRVARYLDGRASFRAARSALDTALLLAQDAGDRVLVAELRSDLGELLDLQGDLAEALRQHGEAVAVLAASVDGDDLRLARARAHLARCLNCAGDPQRAVGEHRLALPVLRRHGGAQEVAQVLVDLGYAEWARSGLAASGAAFTEALALLGSDGPGDQPLTALALGGLATVRQDQGDLTAARGLVERGLGILGRVHGEDHPDTAQLLDKLGYVLRLAGDATGAVHAHHRAEAMLAATLGPTDPRVAMVVTNLGLALADAGDPQGACRAQERARSVFLAAYGPDHPHTRLAERRLAAVLADAGSLRRPVVR